MFELSIGKGNVAGVHVDHVNSDVLGVENCLHRGPSRAELLFLFRSPVGENLRGKLGRLVQISTREIEHEWSRHDRHFDDGKFVVEVQENGNLGTENLCDFQLLEPQIGVAFSNVARQRFVSFQCRPAVMPLACGGENDTVNARAKRIAQSKRSLSSVLAQPLNEIGATHASDPGNSPTLGSSGNRIAHRWTDSPRGGACPKLLDSENPRGTSRRRRRDRRSHRRAPDSVSRSPRIRGKSFPTENADRRSVISRSSISCCLTCSSSLPIASATNSATAVSRGRPSFWTVLQKKKHLLQFGHGSEPWKTLIRLPPCQLTLHEPAIGVNTQNKNHLKRNHLPPPSVSVVTRLERVDAMNLDDAFNGMDQLRRLLAKRHVEEEQIDDICQSAFLRWWRTNKRQPGRLPASYLVRLGLYERLSVARSRRQTSMVEEGECIGKFADPSGLLDAHEKLLVVQRAISNLKPQLQEVLLLRFFQGMKLRDIAASSNETLNTVKLRLHRAKRLLRDSLQSYRNN